MGRRKGLQGKGGGVRRCRAGVPVSCRSSPFARTLAAAAVGAAPAGRLPEAPGRRGPAGPGVPRHAPLAGVEQAEGREDAAGPPRRLWRGCRRGCGARAAHGGAVIVVAVNRAGGGREMRQRWAAGRLARGNPGSAPGTGGIHRVDTVYVGITNYRSGRNVGWPHLGEKGVPWKVVRGAKQSDRRTGRPDRLCSVMME